MPRLLSVNTYHYRRGGADVVYLEHAALLRSLGFEDAYFAMHHPDNEPTPWSRYFVDEIEFGFDYTLRQKLAKATKVVWSFEAQRRLRALLAEHQIDIAHLHLIYHHLSPSILPVLHDAGVPVVLTAHDLKLGCPAYLMFDGQAVCERCKDGTVLNVVRHRCINGSVAASAVVAVESGLQRRLRSYQRHVDRIVAPSRFVRDKLVEWGWSADRFVHIPNYVHLERYEPRYGGGDHVLYLGRLSPEKGVPTLLRAAAKAGVPLKLAGTGPLAEQVAADAVALGGDVELLGFLAGDALGAAVREARAVVLPSECYENAPMSVIEAMASGRPVVGARIGGIPELIAEGETGWTFASGSVDDLAARLAQVFATPDADLEAMGREARRSVEARHSAETYGRAVLELYASLGVRP